MNNMLTLEEVRNFLDAEQAEVEKYIEQGKLHAYKIGGTYLRFRKEDVINLRYQILPKKVKPARASAFSQISDFWRFNNFYILSLLIVGMVIYFAIRS